MKAPSIAKCRLKKENKDEKTSTGADVQNTLKQKYLFCHLKIIKVFIHHCCDDFFIFKSKSEKYEL
ncbi:hypothetical protein ASG31_05165 [Chryseobacterium sp. Leaf404]|nr:hypothetical protein ASG31_05165 [Chryseobacterium sp. Leaf404]